MTRIGILHPGEMGVSIAAAAMNNRNEVYWASQGRSPETKARAHRHGITDAASLRQLCNGCEVVLSVCPPHAAEEVARSVIAAGFQGIFVEANAISPQGAIGIGQRMKSAGILFVDGGIIGGPAWVPGETWLYLSGEPAGNVADCFSKGPLAVEIIGKEIGKASALKMCYAAYTKGTTALLAAILAAATSLNVDEHLYEQWNRDQDGFSEQVIQKVRRVTAKAWRFEGEMREIASTFQQENLPSGFHDAAAEIYHQMAGFKDAVTTPPLQEIITALLHE